MRSEIARRSTVSRRSISALSASRSSAVMTTGSAIDCAEYLQYVPRPGPRCANTHPAPSQLCNAAAVGSRHAVPLIAMVPDSAIPAQPAPRSLQDAWKIGPVTVPNRVMLAPLAGIGNWFVRLQAQRYGAGMTVSEMVSSFAIHYRNEKTTQELLRVDERERGGGPLAIQLFGQDPEIMRSAAEYVAEHAKPDIIDLNMGCPVPKIMGSGAGAAMLKDPDTAVAVAKAAREGSGLPVTVKLRSGVKKGDQDGYALALRLVE